MSKLATFLRMRNREIAKNLSAEERVELAFKLGEADLESFRATHGLTRAAALAHFRRQRQRGRRPCRCMQDGTG